MASYRQYIPTHFNEYTPKVSVEDFKQGLVIKQQQYDANLQSIKDAFQQTYGLDMTRDVDKEYMKSKQDEIASAINKYGNMDLANSRNASQLTQMIAPLYKDERILNAVSSTNRIKQLTQAQQKLIDKHPDTYNLFPFNTDKKRVIACIKQVSADGNSFNVCFSVLYCLENLIGCHFMCFHGFVVLFVTLTASFINSLS